MIVHPGLCGRVMRRTWSLMLVLVVVVSTCEVVGLI